MFFSCIKLYLSSHRHMMVLALMVCVFSLGAGFVAEYTFGLKPCELCWYQRYAYMAGFMLSALFLLWHTTWHWSGIAAFWGVMLSFAANAFFAVYQVMVEQKILITPSLCKGVSVGPMDSFEAFQDTLKAAGDHVPCDQIPWEMFGVSMAGYNAMLTLGMTALLLYAALRAKKD